LIPSFFGSSNGLTKDIITEINNTRHLYKPIILNTSIPIVDYGYLNGKYIGPQLNPITIAQSATRDYDIIKKSNYKNETAIINLITKADWFLGNSQDIGNYSILEYHFDFPSYNNMKPPWLSSMAQSQAIQALIKANNLTNDNRYLNLSDRLLNAFFIEVKDGGVTYKDKDGWWFEEYANAFNPQQPRVLNGMGFTLLGIYDYYEYTHSLKAKFLFDKGLKSFIDNLGKYDNGILSNYDALGKPADLFYHKIHLEILDKLYHITGNNFFKNYYDKWKSRI
jgi:heparosan-N-sulfate-glucuronate 5-epimerase